jgi:hypothetical protein
LATLSFLAGGGSFTINNLSGSGLGFFSGGFGQSVAVAAYQDTTFITDGNGVNQGPQVNNVKYMNIGSGIINSASSGVPLTCITNQLATLNIRFNHTSAVKTQNARLRIYDRTSIDAPASGVSTKVAQVIHPDIVQNNNGSGDSVWIGTTNNPLTGTLTVGGSGIICTFVSSPGPSGLSINGTNTTDSQHDWYAAISGSPDSIGSKTLYGLYFSVEYL